MDIPVGLTAFASSILLYWELVSRSAGLPQVSDMWLASKISSSHKRISQWCIDYFDRGPI